MNDSKLVFWDFDGVIKDSVMVKTESFERLFLPYGQDIAGRVRAHHEANGGVSRYKKIPIYLDWAGLEPSPEQVSAFCDRFGEMVRQAVIDSPWVPGVREYLMANHGRQRFVLVTATPQEEIEDILRALALDHCFCEVHGAPRSKTTAIRESLQRWQCLPDQAVMIGDSDTDLAAADANGVPFLLRRTPLNHDLQKRFAGPMFDRIVQ